MKLEKKFGYALVLGRGGCTSTYDHCGIGCTFLLLKLMDGMEWHQWSCIIYLNYVLIMNDTMQCTGDGILGEVCGFLIAGQVHEAGPFGG